MLFSRHLEPLRLNGPGFPLIPNFTQSPRQGKGRQCGLEGTPRFGATYFLAITAIRLLLPLPSLAYSLTLTSELICSSETWCYLRTTRRRAIFTEPQFQPEVRRTRPHSGVSFCRNYVGHKHTDVLEAGPILDLSVALPPCSSSAP